MTPILKSCSPRSYKILSDLARINRKDPERSYKILGLILGDLEGSRGISIQDHVGSQGTPRDPVM